MAEVLGYQVDSAWEDKEATGRRVRRLLEAAPPPPGSLLVFAEMFATGFSFDVDRIAEDEQGQTHQFLAAVSVEFRCFVLGGVVGRGSGGKGRNEAVAVDPQGRTLARYRKLHPFSFAGEHHRFEPGETLVRFHWNGMVVAPLVCYDLRFPEAFRVSIRQGTHLFCVLANWPLAREDHWLALLRARAIENQAYVVGVNRCGCDPRHRYGGRSQIIDPAGLILADAGASEGVIRAALSAEAVAEQRRRFPALADMRPDLLPPDPEPPETLRR